MCSWPLTFRGIPTRKRTSARNNVKSDLTAVFSDLGFSWSFLESLFTTATCQGHHVCDADADADAACSRCISFSSLMIDSLLIRHYAWVSMKHIVQQNQSMPMFPYDLLKKLTIKKKTKKRNSTYFVRQEGLLRKLRRPFFGIKIRVCPSLG